MLTPRDDTDPSYRQEELRQAGLVFVKVIRLGGQSACSVPLLNTSASTDPTTVVSRLQNGHDENKRFSFVGTRLLMLAAAHGDAETVRVPLDAGDDVRSEALRRLTSLHAGALQRDA